MQVIRWLWDESHTSTSGPSGAIFRRRLLIGPGVVLTPGFYGMKFSPWVEGIMSTWELIPDDGSLPNHIERPAA